MIIMGEELANKDNWQKGQSGYVLTRIEQERRS